MFFFCKLFERGKGLIPQLCKVVSQERQPLGIQFVNPPCAFATVAHQSRLFQHPQVLGNRRPGYRQPRRKLVHCLGMVPQHLENGQPSRVTERRESALQVSIHLP